MPITIPIANPLEALTVKELNEKYLEWLARIKARGLPTLIYTCPHCAEQIEDRAAPEGETWDTLAVCPHCTGMGMKITTAQKITFERVA